MLRAAEGRTLWIDGWLLSDTEARLYALAALAPAASNAHT